LRLSELFGKTLRETPAEADTVSHQLLLKAGMIYQVAAGVYAYLPLLWRSLRKIERIIREEMDAAGGQEMLMPSLQPLELWQETGRDAAFGKTLFRLVDRKNRSLVLAPTHEEVTSEMARQFVRSYRDLPLMVYQIQTKFRDEPRPRGGLVRVREFAMKDLYSFDADQAGLDISYQKMVRAYTNVYRRCGLTAVVVEADSGAIGGKDSHEFMLIVETGENEILFCSQCDYAANEERAELLKEGGEHEEPLPMEPVDTPQIKTIDQLATFLRLPHMKTLKVVLYVADGRLVMALIRGDLQVNGVKLTNALKGRELRLAGDAEIEAAGLVPGFASPVGVKGVYVVADDSITLGANFVAGANQPDTHVKNVNYPRDFRVDALCDIASAQTGDRCARCGGKMRMARGIEVGHVFKLGTLYSEKMGATYLDRDGTKKPILMGSYGIGLGRLLAAAIEQHHDEQGIIWPATIAPYQVQLIGLNIANREVADASERIYAELLAAGYDVLFDDRAETAGVKFNDADLLGMPVRVTVSQRTLAAGSVELMLRKNRQPIMVALDQLVVKVGELLAQA